MSENRLSNLIKDLSKAKQQALLIEVLQSDLESLSGQNDDAFKTVCNASAKVFDVGVKSGKTNVLMVDEAQDQAHLSVFRALLNSLDEEFDDLHKREILQKLTGFGLSQALGSGVGDAVSESLSVGAEKMMDYLAEWTGSASDFMASAIEMGVEAAAEQSGDLLETAGETGAEAVTGYFSSDNEMYLSRPARKRLKELAPRLSEHATSHETLQLALEMLLATAQGAPKVIVVKDPTQLDDASLALLAMLVSVEKDLRQLNHNEEADEGKAQTAGITVVLTFTGRQPHDEGEDKVTEKKLRAILRLRMMASRYSLLERLDSDIPVPAVRASTFVGRGAELRSLWQDLNRICTSSGGEGVQTWALIKGEPGTGKTALANRFIQQVRSDTANPGRLSIPILRMLNQTGHSAQATGLASLKNSIVDELRRLNLMREENVDWFARTREKLGDASRAAISDARSEDPEARKRTLGRLGGLISKLMSVDSLVDVGRSVKSLSEQDEMSSLRQEEFGRSSKANQKDDQYKLLRGALSEMNQLAHKCQPEDDQRAEKPRPMILLVDDLQWMDDFTAEFLVNEWPANLPVYVIATARGSDSFAAVTESRVHQRSNRYRNALFAELGVIDVTTLNADERLETPLSLAGHLDLKGMDQPMLANLIRLTYRNITADQAEPFAAAVIRNLAGEAGASDIITLFAIETLNVISDPQFYRRNAELPRLIEPEGTDRYRFKAPESTNLTQALDTVFKKLTETYQASYLIDSEQGTGGARFNLASYAILEERLHLIEQHFGEHGGAARYSLLFSALLGSPFESGLVRHVLDELQQLSPQEHPEMTPFLEELQAKAQGGLEPAQYEILERAYEIIRRLEENTGKYAHQHSLLRQFLLGQFTRLVDDVWQVPETLELGIAKLVKRIKLSGNAWFEARSDESSSGQTGSGSDSVETEREKFRVALTGYWHRLMVGRTSELGPWSVQYAASLNNLGFTHKRLGRPEDALLLHEEALSIQREGYKADPERWAEGYARSLNNLATTHHRMGRPEDALPLMKEALSVRRAGYKADPEHWAEDCASSLNNLAFTHDSLDRPEDALPLYKEALSIRRKGYETASERWAEDYATSLSNLASTHQSLSQPEDALLLHKEALSIRREGYETSPERWAQDYVTSLNNLAAAQKSLGRPEDALSIRRKAYEVAPERWAEDYASSLNSLAVTYQGQDRASEALPLFEEALLICREGYESEPQRWAVGYAKSLNDLAVIHYSLGRLESALPLLKEALPIRREGYKTAPDRWAQDYVTSLNNLAATHASFGRLEAALPLLKEALSIRRAGYETAPEHWAEDYARSLTNLSVTYEDQGRASEALLLYEEGLSVRREGYESEPQRWAEDYAANLSHLARTLESMQDLSRSLEIWQEAKDLASDESSLQTKTRLALRMESLIMSARLLRMLRRYPEAFAELDVTQSVLTEMDATDHAERRDFRAWSLIVHASTLLEAGDVAAAKALLPKAEALIRDHSLEDLADGLDSLRSDIESADHSGG